MSWKHEEPLEEETANSPAPQANPVENGSHEVGDAPLRNLFGSPVTNLSERGIFIRNSSPIESNHSQASGVINTSQQGPPTDIDSPELENGDGEHSTSVSNSPHPRTDKRVLRPTTGEASRPSRKKPAHKDEQLQPATSASLGPVHLSKVSKAAGKKKPGPQLNISKNASPGSLPLSSSVDTAEPQPSPPPNHITPRRSNRIQAHVPSVAKGSTRTASTDPPNAQSDQNQNGTL